MCNVGGSYESYDQACLNLMSKSSSSAGSSLYADRYRSGQEDAIASIMPGPLHSINFCTWQSVIGAASYAA